MGAFTPCAMLALLLLFNVTQPGPSGLLTETRQAEDDACLTSSDTAADVCEIVAPDTSASAGPNSGILWWADHEDGTVTQWDGDDGGGKFNSGNGDSDISTVVAHSGSYSVRQVITMDGDPANGTRLFRWDEADLLPEAYYSVWYFFPQKYTVNYWWNLFQFKSKLADESRNDPFWELNIENRSSGEMYLYAYNWVNRRSFPQMTTDLPVARWVHVEAFLRQSDADAGRLTVWQDGVLIVDLDGITTTYTGGRQEWSVNNYGDGISPSPVVTYIDDAVIRTSRVGTAGEAAPVRLLLPTADGL